MVLVVRFCLIALSMINMLFATTLSAVESLSKIQYTHAYWIFLCPIIGAAADIITGWIQASVNGTWNSSVMRKGLYRKGGEFLVVIMAYVAELAIDAVAGVHLATCLSMYIGLMELISVIENLNAAGVPVPTFLKNRLDKIKENADKNE